MRSFLNVAVLAASAQALVPRSGNCCFHLTASGGGSGPVGQLSDGQNRIGDNSLPTATYCISSNGGLTDENGRGCILTPPTTQFQCDTGATPTPGFSVNSQGKLTYNGSTKFYACETGQNGGLNIYTQLSSALSNCKSIELNADSCAASSGGGNGGGNSGGNGGGNGGGNKVCPTTLTAGNYEFPHLIVPVNSASPNTEYGTSFNGKVTSTISSIFNFDIPSSDSGKTCSLVFLFPNKSDLQTSSYTFSGDGKIDIAALSAAANTHTTYSNAPSVSKDLGTITISPGNSYVVSTFACPAGERVAYEMKNAGSTNLDYFQDYNPAP
ncbi:hypothetical protein N7539_001819 [Penicillium diatomitis]|uniref:Ubiquitin 3 binding protein But2 C-terminal domain-containing protein n=1 Tax=Penicillium diatomitis TaxID=2819901 RepID=A0A9X0C041_9EURO|nr:uncharacterized protein N7539_001819 [Penicillium diatomitis]KAJ5493073.1 hypothetical protein N7539_001819 [Penicillium diatomitis]